MNYLALYYIEKIDIGELVLCYIEWAFIEIISHNMN